MIRFHYRYPSFRIPAAGKVKAWLEKTAKTEKKKIQSIDYIFVTDGVLLGINEQALAHDYYTDVITFPYSYNPIHGEIFISIDRIKDHAVQYGVPFTQELMRVMIHGLLHLCGYDDKSKRNKMEMTVKEDTYLELL